MLVDPGFRSSDTWPHELFLAGFLLSLASFLGLILMLII